MSIELLSPAGSLIHMRYAFAYGADAVYAGSPRYSLRVRNNQFDLETLAKGIQEAHQKNKKFYVVSNIAPHNRKLKSYLQDIKEMVALKPDALIVSDVGIISMLLEHHPEQTLHLSVQANAINYESVKFWYKMGIKRVILSRELSILEIKEIHEACPKMELEVFVHGALCMAHSGRCLLSGYLNQRDANQGACTNACRWNYKAIPAKEDEFSNLEPVMLLEEEGRKGELLPAFEDEHGTYIMNSKDLCAIMLLEELAAAGVISFKIEGRTKSAYYCARTAQAYRGGLNDLAQKKPVSKKWFQALEGLSNRGYTQGFFAPHLPFETQNYETNYSRPLTRRLIATASEGYFLSNNKISCGKEVELMRPEGNLHGVVTALRSPKGEDLEEVKGSDSLVSIALDGDWLEPKPMNLLLEKLVHPSLAKDAHVSLD